MTNFSRKFLTPSNKWNEYTGIQVKEVEHLLQQTNMVFRQPGWNVVIILIFMDKHKDLFADLQ